MACDPARADAILTSATVLLVRAGALRRHLEHRHDLSPEVAAWLETSLDALMRSVHDLARLATEEGDPGPAPVPRWPAASPI